jgi:hypothetical protein
MIICSFNDRFLENSERLGQRGREDGGIILKCPEGSGLWNEK